MDVARKIQNLSEEQQRHGKKLRDLSSDIERILSIQTVDTLLTERLVKICGDIAKHLGLEVPDLQAVKKKKGSYG